MPPDIYERLTAWRKELEQAQEAAMHRRRQASEDEASVLGILKTMLWLLGLGSCFLLAWRGSGESVIVTAIIMLLPIGAWFIFGLSRWGLLLPIGLLGALALQGALLLS
jgi:hypothetical protein